MSGAMARYPAAASASNWCRHEYQHSGKPWQRSTVGPLPASARCIRMPFVSINRCEIVIANLRKIQSHCELQPQPKWLRRHPVERRTAKTTCSTNLFSSPHRASGSIGARSASGKSRRLRDVCFSVRYPQYRTFTSDWDWPARRLAAPELQTTGARSPGECTRSTSRFVSGELGRHSEFLNDGVCDISRSRSFPWCICRRRELVGRSRLGARQVGNCAVADFDAVINCPGKACRQNDVGCRETIAHEVGPAIRQREVYVPQLMAKIFARLRDDGGSLAIDVGQTVVRAVAAHNIEARRKPLPGGKKTTTETTGC